MASIGSGTAAPIRYASYPPGSAGGLTLGAFLGLSLPRQPAYDDDSPFVCLPAARIEHGWVMRLLLRARATVIEVAVEDEMSNGGPRVRPMKGEPRERP